MKLWHHREHSVLLAILARSDLPTVQGVYRVNWQTSSFELTVRSFTVQFWPAGNQFVLFAGAWLAEKHQFATYVTGYFEIPSGNNEETGCKDRGCKILGAKTRGMTSI
jgi:hypothetical protein